MNLDTFMASLAAAQPPEGSSVFLQSLWYDKKGDWKKAHDLVDSLPGREAARVHAYLHRVEGDEWNAGYWYDRAAEKKPALTLEEEWQQLVGRFLNV
ncbi:hypothetical protein [Chitinophaga vietnamensis]|uniref:hypothetical protein n=1 Tax=Chitinophaga vietnamensis TaxID=2593957 RepID=UPI001177F90A|nr:hypothetical protein [Chitinophaga vietnamensis]